jgi:atypical dual specificity phosphatase
VVVTHDLRLARRIADHVCLFVAGQLHADMTAADFFARPPTELASRFVVQGNCWPAPPPPPLPVHFRWLIPGRLAGMGRPGLLADAEEDLTAIASAGVEVLVSLTEERFSPGLLRSFGIEGRHLPVRDMGIPAVGPMARLCREIERQVAAGRGVAVHCHAGLGRTGTALAAVLVWLGREPQVAIAQVRDVAAGYIQTPQQERFVFTFAESV